MHPSSPVRHFVPGVVVAVLLSLLLAGCVDSGKGDPEARAKLIAAIDKTVAAKSLHIDFAGGSKAKHADGSSGSSADYQAPDRLRTIAAGVEPGAEGFSEFIQVGTTIYTSAPSFQLDPAGGGDVQLDPPAEGVQPIHSGIIRNKPGTYWKTTVPASDARKNPHPLAQNIFGELRAVRNEKDVIAVDGTHFKVHGPHMDATVVVEGGYVTSLMMTVKTSKKARDSDPGVRPTLSQTIRYSAFNSAPVVNEPPASAVVPGPPPMTSPSGDPAPVKLPSLPRSFVPSDLQVRRVIGQEASACRETSVNPDPAREAVLKDSSGACYQLGASDLRITHVAEASAARTRESEIAVNIKLDDSDGQRLDSVTGRYLGRTLAIVMFGRVLSSTTVNTARTGGRMQISPVDVRRAAEVIASLRG